MVAPVLLNWIAAGLFLGLLVALSMRPPPRRLWLPLLAFQVFVLLYILGDAITLISRDMFWEQIGIAVEYSGSLAAAPACWIIALRYAEAQGRPLRWAGPAWVRLPIAASAVAWLVMITNPWHGQFLVPVIGAHNQHLWPWYPLVSVGYLLVTGAVVLLGVLAWRAPDAMVRANAAIMAGGLSVTLAFNHLSYQIPAAVPFDLTVAGLGLTGVVFLYGSYRTRLFALLPIASREVLRHQREGLLLASPAGRLLYANPAAVELLGLETPTPELNVFSVLSERLLDAEGRGAQATRLEDRLSRESTRAEGLTFRLAGGAERWIRLQLTEIPSRSGRVVARSLLLWDVTEQRQAGALLQRSRDELEQHVRERTQALRASEERYRAVSELSSDASFGFRLGPDGAMTGGWITQAIKALTGLEPRELDALGWSSPLHPDDRARVRRELAPLLEGGACETVLRILTRDREVKWLELHAAARRESGGTVQIIGAVRDVTERRRAEVEKRILETQVQQSQRLESLGVLAGGIAHDFNNLLAVVLGNTGLVLQELEKGSPLRGRIERIRSAGEYAAQLTDQMLTYAGRSRPKRVALDLVRLLTDMLGMLRASGTGRCSLETELPEGMLPVAGDATQLRQVVVNLVTNAREALGERGGTVRLRAGRMEADRAYLSDAFAASGVPPGEYAYLEVSDEGAGMDEATRTRIFEPFFTTKFSGRGLGLAVVFGIVRAHSGAIKLVSRPGAGTSFRILLPQAEMPLQAVAARTPVTPAPPGTTVLLADDDEGVLEIAELFLVRAGFQVRRASGGKQAVELFAAHAQAIDAVVLDLGMPEVNGCDALRAIRHRRPDIPVILTSGLSEKMAFAQLDESDRPPGFLHKPYGAEELVDRLCDALSRSPGTS